MCCGVEKFDSSCIADAIVDQGLKMTYDPANKAEAEQHVLTLGAVPPLVVGSKPDEGDDDNSTEASSMPPDSPVTSFKSPRKESAKGKEPAKVREISPSPFIVLISLHHFYFLFAE